MGNTTWVHHARVASFKVTTEKGKRVFTADNERAKKLARKLGKRTRLSASELKPYQGYYKLRQRTAEGALKPIRF